MSITPEALEQLSVRLAADTFAAIQRAVAARLGDGQDVSVLRYTNRLTTASDPAAGDTYSLDGVPFLRLGPTRIVEVDGVVDYERDETRL